MSNETKREVFEDVLFDLENPHPKVDPQKMLDRYLAALPDDLPVIPKAVSDYIIWCKGDGGIGNVLDAMGYAPERIASWIYDERNPDVFAHAWVLGVWRVEETGEIVKLERK